MHRFIFKFSIFIICLFIFCGCVAQKMNVPVYPISAESVTLALQTAELPWTIVENETLKTGQVVYTLHDQNNKLVAFISSSVQDGQRLLDVSCMPYDEILSSTRPLAEEDWKKTFILATILYGEFENELYIYDCFINDFENKNITIAPKEQFSEGKLVNKLTYTWEKTVKNIHCRIRVVQPYRSMPQKYLYSIRIASNISNAK